MQKNSLSWIVSTLLLLPTLAYANETRCGWIENDMPAGMTLTDADGEWVIATMTETAEGFEQNMPAINKRTACGCLLVDTDKGSRSIVKIYGGKVLQYKVCRADKNLVKGG